MAASNPQALRVVSVVLKVFGAVPLLIGLGLLTGAGFTGVHRYNVLTKWPTVDAVVARSELASHQTTFANDTSPTTVYEAHIDFQYSVGGKDYTSPTGANYATSSYATMKQKVDTYAPGTHHPIRYNPSNPNDIRYDAGYTFGFFLTPLILGGVGLMFTAIGAGLFLLGRIIGNPKVRCPSCGQMVGRAEASCPNCGAGLAQNVG